MDQLEQYYDDLRAAQTQIDLYHESNVDEDDEVSSFSKEIHAVMKKFVKTISLIGSSGGLDEMIESCFDAYQEALGKDNTAGKFCRKWKQILSKKVGVLELINLSCVGSS